MPHQISNTPLVKYTHPPETKESLSYADLVTLDLSEYDKPGGMERLADQLRQAAHTIGFFYITNIGLTQSQIDQQFAIAKAFFALTPSEKLQFRAPLEDGNYNGYRPLGSVEILPGLDDNLEFYNVFKFLPQTQRPQPQIIGQYASQIEHFQRHMHENVTRKLLRLVAHILELPEDVLVNGHRYEANCDSSLRYMMYRARSEAENEKYKGLYLRGHSDNGTLTYVFQQPVAALQVRRGPDSGWEYIRIPEGKVAVNIADILEFLSNGYIRSGIHRVVAPPGDQACMDRLGLLYFVRPSDDLPLKTLDSPFLRSVGCGKDGKRHDLDISATEWVRARVRKNWKGSVREGDDTGEGFLAKVFYD
ncbi:isopenicillin N synthase-like protein [Metarhizium robertsii]|uniref:2OG-Fe(II) oxygenase family oxidoreductase n=2 Tax=Metarhizium robertsii TaxID=568076 RepID=E9EJG8_METRA|nr:2OG-Fe(II) oxygenase family oxidoreductase [Metarhizium robertsii ARSEF 23]EFZ02964.2 2OG-Fe(II) oxygenase family oxidoreductase [Metarhizium robertsii ARSEF 23]EXU98820.1 isopenicillin N synthase-like protein [Metarhizium robertsii]